MLKWRLLSHGFFQLGLVLLGLAAWDYFTPPDGPGVTIDQPERELATVSPGQKIDLSFQVHNKSRQPARVVGLAEC